VKLTELGDPKYIALETFRKDGQAVKTPVWTVARDGKLLVWTQGGSWKIRRIRNNGRVRVAQCDMRGNVEGPWVEGIATVSDSAAHKKAMRGYLLRKYPIMFPALSLVAALRRENSGQVVVEIVDA
jgi:PPOX class probable F420-dependent enzyme